MGTQRWLAAPSILVAAAVLLTLALVWGQMRTPAPSQAQTPPDTLRLMIEDLITSGTRVEFEFAEPIAPGFTFRESTGADMTVGEDYVCFSEPWNDGLRYRCTPFTNIVTISYLD